MVDGACKCPASGTLSGPVVYSPHTRDAEGTPRYCNTVEMGGCLFYTCGSKNIDLPIGDSGKPCVYYPDGTAQCYGQLESAGEAPPECPDCIDGTPITEPTQVGEPQTSTQTETDPATGTTTNTEKSATTKVNPDGSTTKTDTETSTKTENGQTTTTTKTTTTNRGTDGTVTTTTRTDVTDGSGNTTTTVTGSSTSKEGKEGDAAGNCDPEAADYLTCTKLLSEIADGEAQGLIDGVTQAGTDAIDQHGQAFADSLEQSDTVAEPNALKALVSSVLPTPTSCTDLTMSFKGNTLRIACADLQPLRQWLAWFFGVLTIITIYYIALRPQGSN